MDRITPISQAAIPSWNPGARVERSPAGRAARGADRCEISADARRRAAAPETSPGAEVRASLVARVKAQIAAGTYETPRKLDAVVDKLAAVLARQGGRHDTRPIF